MSISLSLARRLAAGAVGTSAVAGAMLFRCPPRGQRRFGACAPDGRHGPCRPRVVGPPPPQPPPRRHPHRVGLNREKQKSTPV